MIAEWMLYCALCAVGLFAAAAVVERWLLSTGAQVRHVWSAALLLSLAIPAAAYWLTPRKTITIPAAAPASLSAAELSALTSQARAVETPVASAVTADQSFRKLVPTNRVAIEAWIVLSIALSIYFVAGLMALARMRRHWRPSDVCGVRVLVSERTGPAVVNALSPQIVMPEWALAMDRYQLGLMIRHEQEHRRAGDPQLLALAQILLIAMPWNPALWWGVMRLGMAVELDCDARVLRTADPRTYGDLLLEVARPRRRPRLIAATAFAERAGGLERRIRAIARRRSRLSRGARAGAAVVGLAVVGVAWVAPHPSLPPRWQAAAVAVIPVSASTDSVQRRPQGQGLDNAKSSELTAVRPETLKTRRADRTMLGDTVVLPTAKASNGVTVGVPRPAFSPLDSLIYDRLFNGVVMSADQEIAARLLLSHLAELQTEQDRTMMIRNVGNIVAQLRLTQERDSSLLAMLPTGADRALLSSRLPSVQIGGGRRGRSANGAAGIDVPAGVQMGGPRSGGRARVGGGGASPQEIPAPTSVMDDVLFGLLFNGMSLSADQESSARSILATYRQKVAATIPDPLPFQLRLQGTAGVVMRPDSRDALLAILSNDSDRAVVDSRIVAEVRVVNQPRPPQR